MENKIGHSPSGIPWKTIMKLANVSCDADGSWSIVICLLEGHKSISASIGNTIYANNANGLPIKPPSDSISG